MEGPLIPQRGASLRPDSITIPADRRQAQEAVPAPRTFRGRRIGVLNQSAKLLPGTLETKLSVSVEAPKSLESRKAVTVAPEPRIPRAVHKSVAEQQPKSAADVLASTRTGGTESDSGSVKLYTALLSSEMPYSELRQLAWNESLTAELPPQTLHTVRQAWSARKAHDILPKSAGLSLDQIKHSVASDLSKRGIPSRYVAETLTVLDAARGRGQTADVSPHAQQIYYMINSGSVDAMSDTQALVAFSERMDEAIIAGQLDLDSLKSVARDIHSAANFKRVRLSPQLGAKLNALKQGVPLQAEAPPSPSKPIPAPRTKLGQPPSSRSEASSPSPKSKPVPRKRRNVPQPAPGMMNGRTAAAPPLPPKGQSARAAPTNERKTADELAGVGNKLRLNHTPSLDAAQRVQLEKTYGVKTIPITIGGKEVAYLFTNSPDGKPRSRVLFSSHASGVENRPKFQKDIKTTMLFAGTRDNVLVSRTTKFAAGLAAGKASFNDESQIYERIQREVTDYSLDGGIGTTPEKAAKQLAQFRDEGAVNEFDYLLLDRNVKGMHMSDLMQALKAQGISHTQMVNHLCRPQTNQYGEFKVFETFDEAGGLDLSTIDPDLSESTAPPPLPPRTSSRRK